MTGTKARVASAQPIKAMPIASMNVGRSPNSHQANNTPITGVAKVLSPARPTGMRFNA